MVQIETNRLIIRDHIPEDLQAVHSLLSNEKAMYYIQDIKTKTLEESKENLTISISESILEDRKKYFFAITIKESGLYLGEIGFTVLIDCPFGKIVELGYFILPDYWGKGVVTEATEAVMEYAFTVAGVLKIEVGCIKENIGSERVMQKVGMVKEAEFKNHAWLNDKLYDRVGYRMLKEEWIELHCKV